MVKTKTRSKNSSSDVTCPATGSAHVPPTSLHVAHPTAGQALGKPVESRRPRRRTVAASRTARPQIPRRRQRDARNARSRPLPPPRRDLACPHVRKPRSTWASSPTSTPVRPLSPSGSCTSQGSSTHRGRSTPAPPAPTRSRSSAGAASRSRPPWSRSPSATRPSTSSTPRATPTSSPRWSARSACSTARSSCCRRSRASSHRPGS